MSDQSHDAAHEHYIVPLKNYVLNACALAALMTLTVAAAYMNLGPLNPVVAIVIAIAKAVLIVLFFMNTYYNSRLTWVFVVMSFFWLFILIGMFLPDYFARDFPHQPNAWVSVPVEQRASGTNLPAVPEDQLPMDKRVVHAGEGH